MRLHDVQALHDHPSLQRARLRPEWLYTTQTYPILWHHVAKNAGTFLKHLFYVLDHNAPLPHRSHKHDWDTYLVRAGEARHQDLFAHPHAFIVLQPVQALFVDLF